MWVSNFRNYFNWLLAITVAAWVAGTEPAKAEFNWGYYKPGGFKWSKQVPGYGKGVEFDSPWPQDGLVVGQRSVKTPFYAQISKAVVEKAITGGLSAGKKYAIKAVKAISWAASMAKPGAEFGDIIPMGICVGTKGPHKDKAGQFDPDTGVIGTAKPSCHIPMTDGRGFWIDDLTKDFNILALTPVMAHWVDKETYMKNRGYLKSASWDQQNEICRIRFADEFAKIKNSIKDWWNKRQEERSKKSFRVPGAPQYRARGGGLPQLKISIEILPGRVINNQCVVPYKDPALGQRFPTVSKQYEVLVIQTDAKMWVKEGGRNTNLRGRPVAIQHVASGLCLGQGVGLVLTSCFKRDKLKGRAITQPPAYMMKDGTLRLGGKCVISQGTKHGMQLGGCGPDPHFTWFINKDGHLKGSWGRCLVVNKSNQKPGSIVDMSHGHDCASKLGKEFQWRVLPYQQVVVSRSGKVDGQVSLSSPLQPTRHLYNCLTKGGCKAWFRSGITAKLHAKPIGGNEGIIDVSGWKGGPCSGDKNPCTFKVQAGKTYKTAFVMGNAFKPMHLGKTFNIRNGKNCLTASNSGSRPKMTPCKDGHTGQAFQATFAGRSGWLRAAHMKKPVCIYHEEGRGRDGGYGTHAGMGLIQGKCHSSNLPAKAGRPKWSFDIWNNRLQYGAYIRPKAWKYCLEVKGTSVVYQICNPSKTAQRWKPGEIAAPRPKINPMDLGRMLQVKKSGRCIDNMGGGNKGGRLHFWSCNTKNVNQRFIMIVGGGAKPGQMPSKTALVKLSRDKNPAFQIRSAKSGLCLEVAGNSRKNGAVVHQQPCQWKENQKWKKAVREGGWYQLVSQHSGNCLDLAGGRIGDRVPLQMWECAGGKKGHINQLFRDATGLSDAQTAAYMKKAEHEATRINRPGKRVFQVRVSGKCIDNTGSKNKGAHAHQWDCHPHIANQQFEVIDAGGGYRILKSRKSGLCLAVAGVSKKNGAAVIQWNCSKKYDHYKVRFVAKKGGWYEIRFKHSNKCMDIRGASKKNGAKIQQWDCKNVPQHHYREFK